jgi:hypothetical protein
VKGETLEVRFRSKVAPPDANGCELWTGGKFWNGYGVIWRNGKHAYAHRTAWELGHGEIPDGKIVCHRCDVKLCVADAHLFLGTDADNSADKVAKGRQARGAMLPQTKLSEADVLAIRAIGRTRSQKEISAMFGVSQSVVSNILSGKRRVHL